MNQEKSIRLLDFFRHRSALVGSICVLILIVASLLADLLSQVDAVIHSNCTDESTMSTHTQNHQKPLTQCAEFASHIPPYRYIDTQKPIDTPLNSPGHPLPPGSPLHLFGTDHVGKDLLSQVLYGTRYTLLISVAAVFLGLLTGTLLGLCSGFFGNFIDTLIMRSMDILLALPYLLLAVVLSYGFSVWLPNLSGSWVLVIVIWIVSTPHFARVIRGQVLVTKQQGYVLASRAMGASSAWIMFRSILPNVMAPAVVQSTLAIGEAVLTCAALGILGLGVPDGDAELGKFLAVNLHQGLSNLWPVLFPASAIALAVLGFNLIGDGMRDLLDPRFRS